MKNKMKLIYVCATENKIREAIKYVMDKGNAPVTSSIIDAINNNNWESQNKAIMQKCDEMWVFGTPITKEMRESIDYFHSDVKKRIEVID